MNDAQQPKRQRDWLDRLALLAWLWLAVLLWGSWNGAQESFTGHSSMLSNFVVNMVLLGWPALLIVVGRWLVRGRLLP
ncbi:hypothetical protein [Roseateles saccharophilus]|uniref:Uncharacterized protein n=1 Tax=Roseateles saccharophilus TaxID=304 RepID=A0A4R3UKX9_ROSSA|nr:hypothetical protein [Roseateles saccharophilus]MDG0834189.1 hypothetical protein [Roseateles saccharophilus]TCU91287.1 hypothetical protein EV671_10262 [Roseateles saccharophilus]